MAIVRNEFFQQRLPQSVDPNAPVDEQIRVLNQAYIELWNLVNELREIVDKHDEELG